MDKNISDHDKLMQHMAGIARFMWFAVLPGGPLLILAGLWFAGTYGALPPAQSGMASLWANIQKYYWLATATCLAVGVWMRLNLYTPEALQRMKLQQDYRLPRWLSVECIDELDRRRMDLWRKLIIRNFILLALVDAPVMILVGLYLVVQIPWFLDFAACYSVIVAFLFRPTSVIELIDAAAKLAPAQSN